MRIKALFLSGVFVFGLLLGACEQNAQVDETAVVEDTVAEEIYINNCGNPASAEQTSEHSQTITIEGGAELGFDKIVRGSIEAKYISTKGVVKSQKVTAAPNTNMKFILLWREKVSEGVVTVSGRSGQASYRVSVPISVEQVSAESLTCPSNSQSGSQPTVQIISTTITSGEKIAQVKYKNTKLREGPDLRFKSVGDLTIGDQCELIARYHSWYQVKCLNGRAGWLAIDWLELPAGVNLNSLRELTPSEVLNLSPECKKYSC